jgi:hypothetical protein
MIEIHKGMTALILVMFCFSLVELIWWLLFKAILVEFFLYNFIPCDVGKTEVRIITVQDQGQPVTGLNELEYISNEIWSNVFMVSDPSQLQNVW